MGKGMKVPDKVTILHPEDTLTAAVWHELSSQVSWPVWPLIRPTAIPGETAPWVPESQEPVDHRTENKTVCQLTYPPSASWAPTWSPEHHEHPRRSKHGGGANPGSRKQHHLPSCYLPRRRHP